MTHITALVWDLAGRPAPANPHWYQPGTEPCAMCGDTAGDTAPLAKVLGANFTDTLVYRRPDSTRVCAACAWCCGGKPPATLRMWTVIAVPGHTLAASQPKAWLQNRLGLCLTSRADTIPVADLLADPPGTQWAVTVAVSGQKHVLPYGRVNTGRGPWHVRMENSDITADPATWRAVLGAAATLRICGHGADAIREGAPDPRATKTTEQLDAWRTHAATLARYVRSPLLELALWCCTKQATPAYTRHMEGI